MSTIIKIDKVSKAFLRRVILKDVSLSVEAGHTVGIVGSNGSGKSVLFQIICGFLVPDSVCYIQTCGTRYRFALCCDNF